MSLYRNTAMLRGVVHQSCTKYSQAPRLSIIRLLSDHKSVNELIDMVTVTVLCLYGSVLVLGCWIASAVNKGFKGIYDGLVTSQHLCVQTSRVHLGSARKAASLG